MGTIYAMPALEPPKPETIGDALKLIMALGDAKATAATLKQLASATEAHRAAADEHVAREAAADRKEAELDARLAGEKEQIAKLWAAHEHKVEASQRDHDQRLRQREADLANREVAVAKADAEYVRRHEDLDRRMNLLRQAGAV
jgi:hypothetical protein